MSSKAVYLTRKIEDGTAEELKPGEPISRYFTLADAVDDMPNGGGGIFNSLGRLVSYVAPRPATKGE